MASANYTPPANGIVGGYTGDNKDILRAMIAFSAIAWYNCAELIFLICLRFKKWKGLYFWSLMVTSWAIVIYQIGSYGKMSNILPNPALMTAFTNVGWVFMIGGNSLVLYSRLHLLTQNRTLLRCVLWGILINTFCMYVPTTALDIGANLTQRNNPAFTYGYSVMERIQMTLFTVQEFAISGVYLVEAYRFLKIVYVGDRSSRNIMYELLAVNITIIILDIALLSVAHKDLFQIEVTLKGLVYSIKLKLELGVLSRLVRIVTSNSSGLQRTATFENDLANIATDAKAFNGLEFCTSPLPNIEHIEKGAKSSSDTTSASSRERAARASNAAATSVPWLTTNARSVMVESSSSPRPSSRRRRDTLGAISPTRRPSHSNGGKRKSSTWQPGKLNLHNGHDQRGDLKHKHKIHPVQRGESYANSEFLTSAAVTEGANDDNIRQFQKEIEAELGSGGGRAWGHRRSLPSYGSSGGQQTQQSGPADGVGAGVGRTARARQVEEHEEVVRRSQPEIDLSGSDALGGAADGRGSDGEEEDDDDDAEEEWARGLGVLGKSREDGGSSRSPMRSRPDLSRESSLGRLYPGRITGENG